ncbi:dentin sialophosphoprotein-like isoform X1 [Zingiber officinale]|uniref:dentin sialophosphoprotein-like isoform X1 n=1 Tax=Zingiber officinale TaxID=94328 RepID=UPI001C4D60CE|nr:dentin sialophosphoprotein-like isoform X1 [Zingiber officinale]
MPRSSFLTVDRSVARAPCHFKSSDLGHSDSSRSLMASAADANGEETQVLDIDSPEYGEMPILYGETQALDGSDGDDDRGIDERGTTQQVDVYEETAEVYDSGEGTDGTEVLSGDEEEFSDEGAVAHCGDGKNGADVELLTPAIGGDTLCLDDKKTDAFVDSDATTDDDGDDDSDQGEDAGPARRSFAAVRVAAVRSSGLAAAQCFASRMSGDVSRSFLYPKNCEMGDNSVDGHRDFAGIIVDELSTSRKYPSSLSTEVGKSNLDYKVVSFQKSTTYLKEGTKSRCFNMRVKRLFNELLPSEMDENADVGCNISKVNTPHLLTSDNGAAGLSYVVSQEPSDLSQANALDIVDQFLLINDVGSSQENKNVGTDTLKSPHVSGAKIVQLVAERTNCTSPVGKPEVFDWNDSLEDEGGGEIFTKRKDSFFDGNWGGLKSHSHFQKSRQAISHKIRDEIGKHGRNVANFENTERGNASAHSDSRFVRSNVVGSGQIHISETNIKKNLFKDQNEEANLVPLQNQLDASDTKGGSEGSTEVGPDTQMAAEAMEALFHGSPFNEENGIVHPAVRNPTQDVSKNLMIKRFSIPPQKRTSIDCSDGIITRSKKRKMLSTKSREKSPKLLKVGSTSSKTKNNLAGRTVASRDKERLVGQPDDVGLVSGHDSFNSSKKNPQEIVVNEKLRQENHILVDNHFAYQTRSSKRFEQKRTSLDGSNQSTTFTDALISKDVKGGNALFANEVLGSDLSCKVNKHQATQTKPLNCTLHREELHTSFPIDGSHYPKRRTDHVTSGNLNCTLNKTSSEATDESSKQGMKKKIFVRSIADILDKAKRKRRSNFTCTRFHFDREPWSTTVLQMIYGTETRSSLKSPVQPVSDGDRSTRNNLLQMSSNANVQDKILDAEKSKLPTISAKHDEDATHSTFYESPAAKVQPQKNLVCRTTKDTNVDSPICTANDPTRLCIKTVSSSIATRELRRLEAFTKDSLTLRKDTQRRKNMTGVRVLFSHHLVEQTIKQQRKILACLGLPIASSISEATHFVSDKFVRTQNMLEAIATGKPVVTPMWLESCRQANCYIDEKNYILKDTKKEREIGFNMCVSIARACQSPLLQGKRVFITSNVKPNRELIASLVKACNGQAIKRFGRSAKNQGKVPGDLLVISCEEDYSVCISLLEKGVGIFSSELLLNGIVIQKLEYERHQLFLDHVKQTRSTMWLRHKG